MENTTISGCSLRELPIYNVIARMTFAIVGFLLNSLLLVGLIKDPLKCFRNSSSYLVTNLCASDILTCVTEIGIIFWRSPCVEEIRVFLLFRIPLHISFSSVLTLAFDRYMSCCHPLKYKIVITKKFTKCLILLQWLFYIVESTLEMFYEKWLFYPRYIVGMCIILSAIIMYAKAAYVLKKKSRYLQNIMDQPLSIVKHQKVRLLNEKRITTIFMVSCISLFTFSPLIINDLINGKPHYMIKMKVWSFKDIFQLSLLTLFLANYWVNPIVYSWRLSKYRKTLLIVGRKLACRDSNSNI